MVARSVEKYVRMSPRKVRYLMAPLRNRTVGEALNALSGWNRRAAKPLKKAITSAFANARQADPTVLEDQLIISHLSADGGPVWRRFRAAAFGRAVTIRKPTTHIIVELDRRVRQPIAPQAPAKQAKAPAPSAKPHAPETRKPARRPHVVAKKAKVSTAKK